MRPKDMTEVEFWQDWKPWIGFCIIGLFILGGWIGSLNNSALKRDSFHSAEVARCMASRPVLQKFSTHVKGVNRVTKILVVNSAALLEQTPKSDPQHDVRKANLIRLIYAREDVKALPGLPVPTRAQCRNN